MKKKIDDLKKAYAAAEKENAERAQQIAELETTKKNLDEKARQAAIAADQKTFDECKRQAEFISYRVEALKETQEAKKNITLPLEEVKEVWTAEEKTRREKLEAKAAELEKAKDKLKAILNEIVDLENDGLKNRNICGKLAGIEPYYGFAYQVNKPQNFWDLSNNFPMKYYYPLGVRNPETVYYLQKENRYTDTNDINAIFSKLFNEHSPINTAERNKIK